MDYEEKEESVRDSESDTSSVNGSDVLSEYSGGDLDGEGSGIEDYDEMDEEAENDDDEPSRNAAADLDVGAPYDNDDSDADDDDDAEDENYLQKLDDHFRQKVIENHHPELKTLNYEEIEALATVVRDKNSIIIDPLHRTIPVLTRYEKARLLGERAKQINMGAKPFIEVEESMFDGYLIALKELDQKMIPFIIQRPLPNGGSEYWRASDLEVLC